MFFRDRECLQPLPPSEKVPTKLETRVPSKADEDNSDSIVVQTENTKAFNSHTSIENKAYLCEQCNISIKGTTNFVNHMTSQSHSTNGDLANLHLSHLKPGKLTVKLSQLQPTSKSTKSASDLTPKDPVDKQKRAPNLFKLKPQYLKEAMENPDVKPRLSYAYMIAMALKVFG